jgi:16S rRNA (adenine1518-N6/adenine1519-N6)-dimethyltransferase
MSSIGSNEPLKLVARKRFGQHFLIDRGVIATIVEAIAPVPADRLVEIGPGRAALTEGLLDRVPALTAIEIDRDLAGRLRTRYPAQRLNLIVADALSFDYSTLSAAGPLRLVGNLPYNISSPLLVHLIAFRKQVIDQHFMLQREVVERIVAAPGRSAFGRLSVMLQAYYHVESLFEVDRNAFDPPPKVASAVLRMLPHDEAAGCDFKTLEGLVAQAFSQRRKMLRGTLIPWLEEKEVAAGNLDPTARPEDVSVQTYIELALALAKRRPGG